MIHLPHSTATHRGPLVVKLGGAAIDDPAAAPWVWTALSRLHEAHRAARTATAPESRELAPASRGGGGVVLVHGGGKAVDRMLDRLGLPTERRDGIRLTPPEQIDPIVGVLAGSVNKALVGWLQRCGTRSVGLCLGDGGLCTVRTAQRHGFDVGRVGEVVGGDPHLVRTLLDAGMMPVISSIGLDADGGALNVNADEAAAGIAAVLDARGLVLLTDVAGVLDRAGGIIPSLDATQIESAIADGTISGGMIPKVRGALDAARSCGAPVTIAAWNRPDQLEALVSGRPAGTVIVASETLDVTPQPRVTLDEPELPALAAFAAGAAPVGGDACRR